MPAISDYRGTSEHVWDTNTLDWAKAKQAILSAESVTIPGTVTVTGTVTSIGPLTDTQLRAADIKITLDGESVPVTGAFWQGTQPISAVSLPLPTGAATQTTLAAIDSSTSKLKLTPASGSVTGSGNNTLITPASGKKLRLSYASYNAALAVEAGFRFGAAGTLFLRNSIGAGAVIAKDFGDMRYVEGEVDEPLVLNLSLGVATIWNALYVEV